MKPRTVENKKNNKTRWNILLTPITHTPSLHPLLYGKCKKDFLGSLRKRWCREIFCICPISDDAL